MSNLLGKRILFIEPNFFNYGKTIRNELIKHGAEVDSIFFNNNNLLFKFGKYSRLMNKFLSNKLLLSGYKKNQNKEYDFIFAIRGGSISPKSINKIKKRNPQAKTILYLWDSIKENPLVNEILPCFNVVISFDPLDCERYGFIYQPLFFTDEFDSTIQDINKKYKYDLTFIGIDHSDRYQILKKLKNDAEEQNLNVLLYLYTTKLGFYKRKLLHSKNYQGINKNDFQFKMLTTKEIATIYDNSKCVIDIELDVQSGMTMRTFELLAAKKKMITTNQNIKNFELFSENNILVIDRKNPKIEKTFFESVFIYNDKIKKYSLKNWVQNIFNHI